MGMTPKEFEQIAPVANERLHNILNAIVGRMPKNSEEYQNSLKVLQQSLGLNLDDALENYNQYQKDSWLTKRAKDLAIHAAVAVHKAQYIKDTNTKLDGFINEAKPEQLNDPNNYNALLIKGLKNIFNTPSLADQLTHSFMDYRDLNKPFPFVSSTINYTPTQVKTK
jgi:hypothetical protein